METAEANSLLGYGKSPWVFKGSALYQLHLVKAETARAFIPPWAARVLVNSDKACVHGRKDVGLPSQVANFTKSVTALPATKRNRFGGFMNKIGLAHNNNNSTKKEMNSHTATGICTINLPPAAPQNDAKRWIGPAIKMSLPSFSGRTEYNPNLLKYSCQIECRFTFLLLLLLLFVPWFNQFDHDLYYWFVKI
ncbi:hypothetical protein ABFS82_11G078700 [Erythranthe guttata]